MISTFDRSIIITGEFDDATSNTFFTEFLRIDSTVGDINITISGSEGGDWATSGAGITDLILNSENYIITNAYGEISSTAALVWLAGDHRVMTSRSLLMFHSGTVTIEMDAKESTKFSRIVEKQAEMEYQYLSLIHISEPTRPY